MPQIATLPASLQEMSPSDAFCKSIAMGVSRECFGQVSLAGQEEWNKRFLPSYFRLPVSELHHWLNTELDTIHKKRGERLVVCGPRGSAKSTILSTSYPIRAACEGWERYIILISDTQTQAELFLASIKEELEHNEALALEYPDATGVGSVWASDRIKLRNGVVIEAMGRGGKIRGRKAGSLRPTLIIIDDADNDESAISPTQREKGWGWLNKAVLKAGTTETNFIVIGTRLHRECLVSKLLVTPGWRKKHFAAIQSWPEAMELWAQWELIYTAVNDEQAEANALAYFKAREREMMAGAQVLWPENESLYELMVMRATEGHTSFESEKQNNPRDPERAEWPEEYLDGEDIHFPSWLPIGAYGIRVLTLDPSKGKDAKRGDYSAITRLGVPSDVSERQIHISSDMARRPVEQMLSDLLRHCEQWEPHIVGIETNQFQELLVTSLELLCKEKGLAPLPIAELVNMESKPVRIRRLSPYLARRRLCFKARDKGTLLLRQQLMDFPNGDHDDGPDSLEMAIRLAQSYKRSKTEEKDSFEDDIVSAVA